MLRRASPLSDKTITVAWFHPGSSRGLEAPYHIVKGSRDTVHTDSVYMWNFDLLRKGYLPEKVKDRIEEVMPHHQRLLLQSAEDPRLVA